VPTFTANSRAVDLLLNAPNVGASEQIRSTWALDIYILNVDVRAHRRTGADYIANKRVVLLAGSALEVLDGDIGDCELRGKLLLC